LDESETSNRLLKSGVKKLGAVVAVLLIMVSKRYEKVLVMFDNRVKCFGTGNFEGGEKMGVLPPTEMEGNVSQNTKLSVRMVVPW